MRKFFKLLFIAVIAISCTTSQKDTADIIYKNGRIYTVNESQPWAEALAIKDGRFIAIGDNDDVLAFQGDNTEIVELKGAFVMPGVQENHIHASSEGQTIDMVMDKLGFSELATPKEIQQAIVDYAKEHPGDGWITGMKWGNAHFPEGKPHKSLIDEVMPDRPVILLDETQHNALANSKALEIAGITKDTPQPATGVIGKDPVTGEPTGYLAEAGIFEVYKIIPQPSLEKMKEAILLSQDIVLAYGVTAITDMSSNSVSLAAYKALDDEGKLKLRTDVALAMNSYLLGDPDPYQVLEEREKYRSRLIDPDRVKYIADGTPMSGTSIMLEAYTNNPDDYGIWTLTDEQYNALPKDLAMGLQLSIHSVGDGTTRKVLDQLEKARKAHPENTKPIQIAHPIWVNKDDLKRFKELNIIAEVSPALYFPTGLSEACKPILGEERVNQMMNIKAFLDAGVTVSYGSDWPAGTPTANPWRAVEGMITRMDPDETYEGKLGDPIDLETALRIITMNGAIAMETADVTGSIEVGKYADMVVLNNNPFELVEANKESEIGDILVMRTIFEGDVVYDRHVEISSLEVIDIEITNKDLDNAIDAAELNLIIEKDLVADGGAHQCIQGVHEEMGPGSENAPEDINQAFSKLHDQGYEYVRTARKIFWEKDNSEYWIQWTYKNDKAVLWAYDPLIKDIVEVLRVKEK